MKRLFFMTAVVGILSLTPAASWALGEAGSVEGGAYRSASEYTESLSLDGGPGGTGFYRQLVFVPLDYGKLVNITPSRAGHALWFETSEGTIRNVLISDKGLLVIRREGHSKSN